MEQEPFKKRNVVDWNEEKIVKKIVCKNYSYDKIINVLITFMG
jgi:hypothetical protein